MSDTDRTPDRLQRLADARDTMQAGGKAVALGAMLRAGFHVPDGFVVTTAAGAPPGTALADGILEQFDKLGAALVAVRSSAVAEDGDSAAWAGQFETFLNVRRDALLGRIAECQASAHSHRAASYAKQHGLTSGGVAVIVQAMIQSEVSGVAFSVHPVSGNTGQAVIEAGLGLGEAVVSGSITPDMYVVDKRSGALLEQHVAQQTKMLVQDGTAAHRWVETGSGGSLAKLTTARLAELAGTVLRLESHFGYPVDVEWGYASDTLYILQCRPITTLHS